MHSKHIIKLQYKKKRKLIFKIYFDLFLYLDKGLVKSFNLCQKLKNLQLSDW